MMDGIYKALQSISSLSIVGILIGVGGSLTAIRKFLHV